MANRENVARYAYGEVMVSFIAAGGSGAVYRVLWSHFLPAELCADSQNSHAAGSLSFHQRR